MGIEDWSDDFEDVSETFKSLAEHCHLDPVQTAAATDRITYLPDDLLTKVDRSDELEGLLEKVLQNKEAMGKLSESLGSTGSSDGEAK